MKRVNSKEHWGGGAEGGREFFGGGSGEGIRLNYEGLKRFRRKSRDLDGRNG